MNINHAALVNTSEKNADLFYQKFLGLEKGELKTLPANLANQIFKINKDLQLLNYQNSSIRFEIFLSEDPNNLHNGLVHTCLDIADKEAFLTRCNHENIQPIIVQKGDRQLYFVQDFDQNLFEINFL